MNSVHRKHNDYSNLTIALVFVFQEKNQHLNVDSNSGMQSMVTIMGPRLSQEALKEFGFEGYCPKGHSLFAAHQRVESEGLLDNGTISFGANLERDLVEGKL